MSLRIPAREPCNYLFYQYLNARYRKASHTATPYIWGIGKKNAEVTPFNKI
jgi:hypothetical protein